MLQKRFPDCTGDPIDAAHFARRRIISTDAALEKRVLRDEGGHAIELAKTLTNRAYLQSDWQVFYFTLSMQNVDFEAEQTLRYCKKYGPGLVAAFIVHAKFSESALDNTAPGLGYYKFDGASSDCVGEFVQFEEDQNEEKESTKLREIWEQQKSRVVEHNKKRRANLQQEGKNLFPGPASEKKGDGGTPTDSANAPMPGAVRTEGRTVRHSMVMLGGHKITNADGEKKMFFHVAELVGRHAIGTCFA
jgi:hypothetical protein